MTLYEFLGTVEIGFIFGIVALGAFLSFRVLDFPDLTVEGSFPLGAAVAAVLIFNHDWNPWGATAAGALAGFLAGLVTALLNVRFNPPAIRLRHSAFQRALLHHPAHHGRSEQAPAWRADGVHARPDERHSRLHHRSPPAWMPDRSAHACA